MKNRGCFFLCAFICLTRVGFTAAADTLTSNQVLKDGETLVSSDQTFELGFFSPGSSNNRYLGIRYKDIPDTVVWVANRDRPLTDASSTLIFGSDGNLLLLNQTKYLIWSSNSSGVMLNPVAQLLDTGNLVVRNNNSKNPDGYSWQSFDHPTDTLLAGMKIGWDLRAGLEWHLTSWKSLDDPSPGDYIYRPNIPELHQVELVRMGSDKIYRSGPWNGIQYSGSPVSANLVSKPVIVVNESEIYSSYEVVDDNFITRVTLDHSGSLQRLFARRGSTTWNTMFKNPNDPCDEYGQCGANGICRVDSDPICDCLEGYMPKSPVEWALLDRKSGCVRRISANCSEQVGFLKISWVKVPDLLEFSLNKNISLDECMSQCSKNCSCTAYANSDIRGRGSGCIMWFGDLIDIKEFRDTKYEQHIYIRVTAAEAGKSNGLTKAKRLAIISVGSVFTVLLIMGVSIWSIIWKKWMRRRELESRKNIDLPFFDLASISLATNNFSETNMIGVGGFGPVYKGSLSTGQEIAVKRLSKSSGQGTEEFMNEVLVIAKLQHKNLVGLLGCCIKEEERMLIYEYLPNKSLDYFIFDHDRSYQLEWGKRFNIVVGIARGLLYLHQDSKLQIIHRDLKASNILLDVNLKPKISDFGLARIFIGDEKEARTKRVIGTYGYMSPEYAFDGKFSVKSDIYSFGVLLLEIVSGKRNRGFSHPNHHHNLLGHAWLLWTEGRCLELVDSCLDDSLLKFQVERCIQVGLLCVQKFPQDRPEMSSVVFMLVSQEAVIDQPKEPGFFMERSPLHSTVTSTNEDLSKGNGLTVTELDGR